MGDFNEIKSNDEKQESPSRPERSFTDLCRMIATCDFIDLKAIGNQFSWTRKQYKYDVRCCLDRAMANTEWLAHFPSAQTEFLPFEGSDHCPLVTNISNTIEQRRGQFRYDKRLFQQDSFRKYVASSWNSAALADTDLNARIVHCRISIADWKRNNKTNAAERILHFKKELDDDMSY